jgi:alkyldihydroxyacetonephosphate synthase
MRWWGWGDPAHPPVLPAHALGWLRENVGLAARPYPPVALGRVRLPAARVPQQALAALRDVVGAEHVRDGHTERVLHAAGKGYPDLVRLRAGKPEGAPDAVLYPAGHEQLRALLELCARSSLAVVPFGGGTSVVGGVEARVGDHYAGVVTIDVKALDRVLEVDRESLAARIQAGATGPGLEQQLSEHGLTLRHFPQSFEFSTLGGWIATRAGGHFATLYTHIDDLVESVRALTPVGVWESRRLPGSGAGISPDRMLIGSEGTLGVITEAWVRVRPRPSRRASAPVRFERFMAGAEAVRALSQSGLYPTNCRLIDAREAEVTGAGDGSHALLVLGFE